MIGFIHMALLRCKIDKWSSKQSQLLTSRVLRFIFFCVFGMLEVFHAKLEDI